jgi:hypothetical protein
MKLPSVNKLYKEASVTIKRFPFVLLSSVLGAVIIIYAIGVDQRGLKNVEYLYHAVMVCWLGISLLLSAALFAEKNKWSKPKSYLLSTALISVLSVYYLSLPAKLSETDIIRYALFIIGMHLLVSFIPFIARRQLTGFWVYNEILFIRFLTSGLYSGVLFAGLAIAIVSFDKLFSAGIDPIIYPKLFCFIAGLFNTWFFLSGIPPNKIAQEQDKVQDKVQDELSAVRVYPKGLKVFTQFVLLPLVTVYLFILYLYTGKIILEWSWPLGWVSYLVLGFSVTGIFSILLIYPVRNEEGSRWINKFSKWFYLALFPLIVLLFLAIMRRISEYGITENRYFVFILALWLAGIALYFTISRIKNIKVIPVSLCIIAFLSSFGPWGAFSISTNSQVKRLETYLTQNEILQNGKIVKASNPPPVEIQGEISSILTYLQEKSSLNVIRPWLSTDLDSLYAANDTLGKEGAIMNLMGLKYNTYYKNEKFFNYSGSIEPGLDVRGYDILHNFSSKNGNGDSTNLNIDSSVVRIKQPENRSELIFLFNGEEQFRIDILKAMNEKNIPLTSTSGKPAAIIEREGNRIKIKMIITSLHGERENGTEKLNYCESKILIKVKLF